MSVQLHPNTTVSSILPPTISTTSTTPNRVIPPNLTTSLTNRNIGTLFEPDNPFSIHGSSCLKDFFAIDVDPPDLPAEVTLENRSVTTLHLDRVSDSTDTNIDTHESCSSVTLSIFETALITSAIFFTTFFLIEPVVISLVITAFSFPIVLAIAMEYNYAETRLFPPPNIPPPDIHPLYIPPTELPPRLQTICFPSLDGHEEIHRNSQKELKNRSEHQGIFANNLSSYLYYLQKQRAQEERELQYINIALHNRIKILDTASNPTGDVFFKIVDEVSYLTRGEGLHSLVVHANFTDRKIYYYDSNGYSIEYAPLAVKLADDLYHRYFFDLPKSRVFTQNLIHHQISESTCADHSLDYIDKVSGGMSPEEYFENFSAEKRNYSSFIPVRREHAAFVEEGIRLEYPEMRV